MNEEEKGAIANNYTPVNVSTEKKEEGGRGVLASDAINGKERTVHEEPFKSEPFSRFLSQQQSVIDKLENVIEKIGREKKKDFWDVMSSLSGLFTLLSSIVIAWLGVQFTEAFKKQEVRIAQAQTIEKFIPHLTSENENSRRGALLAVYALQDTDLAARLAASYVSNGTIDACEIILKEAKGESLEGLKDALVVGYSNRASENYALSTAPLEQIISDYNRVLELRPEDYIANKWANWYIADIYTTRANCYRDMGDFDKATMGYDKALQVYPDYGYTYMNIAIMHTNKKDFNAALEYHNKSVESSPYQGQVFTRRAETYEMMGELNKAIADFDRAVENDPYNDYVYLRRARFYVRQKDFDKAAPDLVEVMELTKDERNRDNANQELRRIGRKYKQPEPDNVEKPEGGQKQYPKPTKGRS